MEVEKRSVTDLVDAMMLSSPKRQKTSETAAAAAANNTIQRSELDSALALASLALNSPMRRKVNADLAQSQTVPSVTERAPTATATTSAPPESTNERDQPTPVTPDGIAPKRKRVHFEEHLAAAAAEAARRRKPMMVPPRSAGAAVVATVPPYSPRPPFMPHPQIHHHSPYGPPPTPHPYWMHHPHHSPHARMAPVRAASAQPYLPNFPIVRPVMANPKKWVCDYCNIASFSSFQEACAHEEVCRAHTSRHSDMHRNPAATREAPDDEACRRQAVDEDGHSGSVALAVDSSDREWLSELNCYIRKHCVEAFSASKDDVTKTSKRGRIVLHQVGIRCKFCVSLPLKEREVAAVSYPTSLAGIYESVKRWQRVHLPACRHVPLAIKTQLDRLQNDTVWVPTTRQYWTDSAAALGMVDSRDGIRFTRDPTQPPPANWTPDVHKLESSKNEHRRSSMLEVKQMVPGGYICMETDKEMVPPYVYFLMRQVEPCNFTEADRFVARSKGPIGFAGFQCRHCQGHAGLGKYFPLTSKALSTNSTSQNIHAHLLKCRKCPEILKNELLHLKAEKGRSPRMVPGWRKTFFEMVWKRLHGEQGLSTKSIAKS